MLWHRRLYVPEITLRAFLTAAKIIDIEIQSLRETGQRKKNTKRIITCTLTHTQKRKRGERVRKRNKLEQIKVEINEK